MINVGDAEATVWLEWSDNFCFPSVYLH